MKKRILILAAVMLMASMLLTGCGKSEFSCDTENPKDIVINAQKAEKDAFFLSGSLEVAKGEQIVIEPALEKGSVKVDLILEAEEQDIEEDPDTDAEATYEFEVSGDEAQTVEAPKTGFYQIRATVTDKATGTINVKAVMPQ